MTATTTRPSQWVNRLPSWIGSDDAYDRLNQGPRFTLSQIANRCDGVPADALDVLPLAGAVIGYYGLAKLCGCDRSTALRHVQELIETGLVVILSYGGGRLGNVYGIPAQRGQLDKLRAAKCEQRGTGPGGRWTKDDSERIRRLVSQNKTLALGSQNATAGVAKCDGSSSKMRPQESQNKTLPSHVPAQSPASSPSPAAVADDSGSAQAPDPELVEFLANHGINGTSRDELASLPGLTVPLVRRIFAKLSGDAGPGLKVNTIRATAPDLIVKTRQDAERKQAERDCTQRDAAELQPLADALYAALPDDERQRVEDTVRRNTNRADTDERVLRSGVAEYVAVYQVKCDKTPDLKQAIEVFTKRRDELKHAPRVRSGAASQLAQTLRPEADPPIHEQKTELIRQAAASAGVKPRA